MEQEQIALITTIKGTIMGTIIGGIISTIASLLVQFFTNKYDIEKDKEKEKRIIIQNKYNSIKKIYNKYRHSLVKLSNDYYEKLVCKNIQKEKIKEIASRYEKAIDEYIQNLSDIMEILEEDYYISQKLIEYEKLKNEYIDILYIRASIIHEVFLWTELNALNKDNLVKIEKDFINKSTKIDEQIKGLYYKLQEKLYKDII